MLQQVKIIKMCNSMLHEIFNFSQKDSRKKFLFHLTLTWHSQEIMTSIKIRSPKQKNDNHIFFFLNVT